MHDTAGFFEGRERLRPDAVVPSLRLVIEYDGIQHFERSRGKIGRYLAHGGRANDAYKDEACLAADIHLARIPYTVPLADIPGVVDRAIALVRGGDVLLSAVGSDYYDCPTALPRRPRAPEVIDLTGD